MTRLDNAQIADRLREYARLLEDQQADRFRVGAYRRAAETITGSTDDLGRIFDRDGMHGLVAIPDVGESIARAVAEMVSTGRWMQLDRLRGDSRPLSLFMSVPGIGPETAKQIDERLSVDTLEALEIAAHDGRLETVPGIGPRRAAAIRASLATMLSRRRRLPSEEFEEPPVSLLLDVDRIYHERASSGRLRKIAPRRFNQDGEAWLPILHCDMAGWMFTAMFSNTALAHQLGRTNDWVVIYFHRDHGPEHQRTVVDETRGPLIARRVVRGREVECRTYYFGNNPN